MKTLISLGMAAFVLGFIFSADLAAEEEWEKELAAKGWENVTLENWADTTWYGHIMDVRQKNFDFIRYVYPDGKHVTNLNKTLGSKSSAPKWGWELDKNGKYCIVFVHQDGIPEGRFCGRTIWKKEDSYIVVTLIGIILSKWKIQKGNPEKF